MAERNVATVDGTGRAWFVAIVAYYVFVTYLVPSTAKVERFSFAYFALVVPAWLYVAANWKYLLTGYGTATKMLALFAVLAGISGALRADIPLVYNAAFLSAMAIVILNSRAYLTVVELNWIFLAAVAGSVVVDGLRITEYGFFPQSLEGNCEDAMNWRVSLFRVTAESAMFSLVVFIANLVYEGRTRGWVRGLVMLVAAYFLVFSGVRSIALVALVVIPVCAFISLKRLAAEKRLNFAGGMAVLMIAILSLPYLLGRGDGFWWNYLLRTETCAYKSRYLIPGHPDSAFQTSLPASTGTGEAISAAPTSAEEQKPAAPAAPKSLAPEQKIAPEPTPSPEADKSREGTSAFPRLMGWDWVAWTLNRQCGAFFQLSLLVESPLGTRDIQPESDEQLSELGCPPKQLSKYCAGCTFATYWLARAGLLAIPLLLFFAVLMVDALKRKNTMLATTLAAFGLVSFGWGVMFVPYNFIFLLMMATPAFVTAHEARRYKSGSREEEVWLAVVPPTLRKRNVVMPSALAVTGVLSLWFYATTLGCQKIDVANFVILKSGNYCLAGDIEVEDGVGIYINAKDVALNLEGKCIRGRADAHGKEVGISIQADSGDVRIENGCISGMLYGIHALAGSKNVTVSDMTLQSNLFRGVRLDSDRVTVRNLRVEDTGGTKYYDDAINMGIEVRAAHCEITENEVVETYPTDCGEGIGIAQTGDRVDACEISNNRIANSRLPDGGRTLGIRTTNGTEVRANTIETMTYAISTDGAAIVEDNTLIDEACRSQYLSKTYNRTLNVEVSRGRLQCPDDPLYADRRFSPRDRCSAFRLADIHRMRSNYREAAKYYFIAGGDEAVRRSRSMLESGLINPADASWARAEAGKILADARKEH